MVLWAYSLRRVAGCFPALPANQIVHTAGKKSIKAVHKDSYHNCDVIQITDKR